VRQQIFDYLFEEMQHDSSLFLATADMGINLVERFADAYPERFVNVGIAEQNLVGVAAGLCNAGFRPFLYTISNFLIHRCFEQIRNDLVLHKYPAVLIGTSTGYDNAPLGPTHHTIDDWGCLAGLRDIDVYCPSSVVYAESLVRRLTQVTRPTYVRVPKGNFDVPACTDDLVLLEGRRRDVLLVSYGGLAQNCLSVQAEDDTVSVLVANRLHPLDEDRVIDLLTRFEQVLVVEDHFPQTGLYGALCRLAGAQRVGVALTALGPCDGYDFQVGKSAAYYHAKQRTDVPGIRRTIDRILRRDAIHS